jgi:signal transduction histidine kinase
LVTFAEVLEVNWVILYFVYGQVFFVMGLVTGLQWRRQSQLELARSLPWLAAFGLAHGLNEWGYIFVPLQALLLSDAAVRWMVMGHLLLLAISFFFLLQFGVELLLPPDARHRWLRIGPGLVLLLWGGAVLLRIAFWHDPQNVLVALGDAWSRYLLAFPGAVLAHLGLIRQARHMREMNLSRIARYLIGAAVAFSVYALVGGLMVPTAPVFPANLFNYTLLDRTLQVPAPVFRSLCGLAMAVFVARSLEVFQVETDRRIAEMEQAQVLVADRERIGRELHDGIIQNIYAAGLSLEEAQHLVIESPAQARHRIGTVMQALNQTIQDIRRYIFDLRDAEQTYALERVVENLVRDLRLDTLLQVDLEVTGQRCCWLEPDQVAHITQIAREALSNVVQHADATRVRVNLVYADGYTQLVVSDDGRGMGLDSLSNDGHEGIGIGNMRTRARMLGGDLALASEPGRGLRLVLTIPCDNGTHPQMAPQRADSRVEL